MQFTSFSYVFAFLPLVLLLYHLTRTFQIGQYRISNIILVVASYYFYAWGTPWIAILLFASSIVDFTIGRALGKADDPTHRKLLLMASVCFNIGLLAFFKYANWFVGLLNTHFAEQGIHIILPDFASHLPPGISFYTFQTMSYTIDIYRRHFTPRGTILDYMTYVAFFPQLIAGPIERARNLLPQMCHVRKTIHPRVAEFAVFLICWGITKKVVFADNLGHLIDRCEETMTVPGAGLILALAFTFQIYFDFSAYTDIARGSARLFGVKIRRNFLTPYFSLSPSEFWIRWHRSLSSWLRDYLYISLGGSRRGLPITLRNLFITMFLGGLWHGAGIFFILWGIYHGLLLILYRIFPIDKICIGLMGHIGRPIALTIWFTFVVYGWILFFADDVAHYHRITDSIVALLTTAPTERFGQLAWGLAIFALPVMLTDVVGRYYNRDFTDMYKYMSIPAKALLYVAMFYAMVMLGSRGSYDFIYFQF